MSAKGDIKQKHPNGDKKILSYPIYLSNFLVQPSGAPKNPIPCSGAPSPASEALRSGLGGAGRALGGVGGLGGGGNSPRCRAGGLGMAGDGVGGLGGLAGWAWGVAGWK